MAKCAINGCPHERVQPGNYCIFHETPADWDRKRQALSSNPKNAHIVTELKRLAKHYGGYCQSTLEEAAHLLSEPGAPDETTDVRVANLLRALDAKQAKIDALMLEFCPGEMSAEQRAEWARSQVKTAACHPDPTGKIREPPHCPTCACGMTPEGTP